MPGPAEDQLPTYQLTQSGYVTIGPTERGMAKKATAKKASNKADKRTTAKANKHVYFFGSGKADGNRTMKDLLGGKGSGLAEMTNADLPVPPGFTISTEVCNIYYEQ